MPACPWLPESSDCFFVCVLTVPLDTAFDHPNFCLSSWDESTNPYFIWEDSTSVICSLPRLWGNEYEPCFEDLTVVMTPPNGQRCLVNAKIVVGDLRVISECQCGSCGFCCGLEKERSCGIACTVSGSPRTRIPRLEIQTRLPGPLN